MDSKISRVAVRGANPPLERNHLHWVERTWVKSEWPVTPGVDATPGDYFLQADLPVLIRTMSIWITSGPPTMRELSQAEEKSTC